jgi:hypothetical protein
MSPQPLWRQAVDTVDNAITPAVQRAVHDEAFGLVVAVLHRAGRDAGAQRGPVVPYEAPEQFAGIVEHTDEVEAIGDEGAP